MAATHLTEGRIKALRPRKTTRDIREVLEASSTDMPRSGAATSAAAER